MTVMYSFCFWFSVRLGSIIVGFSSLVQCVLALVACGIGMDDLSRTSSDIDYWLQTNDLMVAKDFFIVMRDDPEKYLTIFIAVLTVYLCSCILLIFGAFKCNMYLMFPFMVLDFVRLIILTAVVVVMMLLVKKNTLDLGVLIGASVLGGFAILYLWYQWLCTVALWQIIREIERLNTFNNNPSVVQMVQPSSNFNKGNIPNKIALVGNYFPR